MPANTSPTITTSPTTTAPPTTPPTTTTPPATTTSPSPTPTPPATTPTPGAPVTATFNFDTGSPTIPARSNTPFDQPQNGVTAHFTSTLDPNAFSLQNSQTTTYVLSQFSGNYLFQNNVYKTSLNISFNRTLTSISFKFATVDYHDPGTGGTASNITLTAYLDSASNTPVGTVTNYGAFTSDTYPEGTLTFTSGGQPFNLIVIELPYLPQGATVFFVDTITATTT